MACNGIHNYLYYASSIFVVVAVVSSLTILVHGDKEVKTVECFCEENGKPCSDGPKINCTSGWCRRRVDKIIRPKQLKKKFVTKGCGEEKQGKKCDKKTEKQKACPPTKPDCEPDEKIWYKGKTKDCSCQGNLCNFAPRVSSSFGPVVSFVLVQFVVFCLVTAG